MAIMIFLNEKERMVHGDKISAMIILIRFFFFK